MQDGNDGSNLLLMQFYCKLLIYHRFFKMVFLNTSSYFCRFFYLRLCVSRVSEKITVQQKFYLQLLQIYFHLKVIVIIFHTELATNYSSLSFSKNQKEGINLQQVTDLVTKIYFCLLFTAGLA